MALPAFGIQKTLPTLEEAVGEAGAGGRGAASSCVGSLCHPAPPGAVAPADLPRSPAGTLPEPEVAGSWVETPQAGANPAPSTVAGLCSLPVLSGPREGSGQRPPTTVPGTGWGGGGAWPAPNTLCTRRAFPLT